jgi:nucleotide-binding universal stress UspA family protein
MTTHGRSGLARALVGSVADEIVRRVTCPVLLIRVSDKDLKAEPKA